MSEICFFVEKPSDLRYFGNLPERHEQDQVIWVTPAKHRKTVKNALPGNSRVKPLWSQIHESLFFLTLKSDIFYTTTPDLGKHHFRRSQVHPTHYIYVFHSLISTHKAYLPEAFDHFDEILCLAPHHIEEIRMREKVCGLKSKVLTPFSYPPVRELQKQAGPTENTSLRVLVAPTWNGPLSEPGPLSDLLAQLSNYQVTLRIHEETARKITGLPENVQLETGGNTSESLIRSDVLISDWSGIAFEYGLGLGRPVIFYDEGEKRRSSDTSVSLPVVEDKWRDLFGLKIQHANLDQLPSMIDDVVVNWVRDSAQWNIDLIY